MSDIKPIPVDPNRIPLFPCRPAVAVAEALAGAGASPAVVAEVLAAERPAKFSIHNPAVVAEALAIVAGSDVTAAVVRRRTEEALAAFGVAEVAELARESIPELTRRALNCREIERTARPDGVELARLGRVLIGRELLRRYGAVGVRS